MAGCVSKGIRGVAASPNYSSMFLLVTLHDMLGKRLY